MSRNLGLDTLKLALAFMIVGLHASFLGDVSPLARYLSVNGLFRIAVPTFLVINGYYFYTVMTSGSPSKWLQRVLVLYLFWMAMYSYYWVSPLSISAAGAIGFVQTLLLGFFHLWYVAGMIGAALLLLVARKLPDWLFLPSIALTFIAGIFIQYAGNYHWFADTPLDRYFNYNALHRNAVFFSYPFFCIGYLINQHALHKRLPKTLLIFAAAAGLAAVFGEAYMNYLYKDADGRFDNLISLLLVCPAVFLLLMKLDISGDSKNIALYSSSVYFIHIFFLYGLQSVGSFGGTALTVMVFAASMAASIVVLRLHKKWKFIL